MSAKPLTFLTTPVSMIVACFSAHSIIINLHFNTVLVAHNGFSFDFPILMAEVERRPRELNIEDFTAKNIHFSDSLPLLRKVYLYVTMK